MKTFKKYGAFVALLFAVLALAMLLLKPALVGTFTVLGLTGEVKAATGLQAIFGGEAVITVGTFEQTKTLESSTIGIAAFALVIAGALVAFLRVEKNLNHGIAAVLLLVAGVLFFFVPGTHDSDLHAGTSLILASVFSFVAVLVNLVLLLARPAKKKTARK